MQKNMKATPCIDEKMVDKWNSNKIYIDTIFEMEIQDEIDAFNVIADESIPPVGERIRINETRNVLCRLLHRFEETFMFFFCLMIHHRRGLIILTCPGCIHPRRQYQQKCTAPTNRGTLILLISNSIFARRRPLQINDMMDRSRESKMYVISNDSKLFRRNTNYLL